MRWGRVVVGEGGGRWQAWWRGWDDGASEEGLVSGEVDWKRRCSVAVS